MTHFGQTAVEVMMPQSIALAVHRAATKQFAAMNLNVVTLTNSPTANTMITGGYSCNIRRHRGCLSRVLYRGGGGTS